ELEADLADDGEVDRARAGAGLEIEIARREAGEAERGQDRAHREVFAIGDEVRLVVAGEYPAGRIDREDAVGGAGRSVAVGRLDGDPAGEEEVARPDQAGRRAAGLFELDLGVRAEPFVLERGGDRGFGPHQQAGLVAAGL